MTKGILRFIRNGNKTYSRLCKTKFSDNMLLSKYKQYRNKLTHIKEQARKNHFKSLLNQSKTAAACSWKKKLPNFTVQTSKT